jgi:hypothetical protein
VDCDEDYNQALYDALEDSDNYCEGKSCGGSDKSGDSGSGSESGDK